MFRGSSARSGRRCSSPPCADIQLATIVTAHPGGLEATHVPTLLIEDGDRLVLECHVARANPHWKAAADATATMAIFQGPHAYVRPGWYASKKEHGKVVPTWNYVAVHAHGSLETFDDADEVGAHVARLTARNEAGREAPWAVTDAPEDYIAGMRKAIVGMRLTVERLEGSWKLIQHKPEADRLGAIDGLSGETAAEGPRTIAELMRAGKAERPGRSHDSQMRYDRPDRRRRRAFLEREQPTCDATSRKPALLRGTIRGDIDELQELHG